MADASKTYWRPGVGWVSEDSEYYTTPQPRAQEYKGAPQTTWDGGEKPVPPAVHGEPNVFGKGFAIFVPPGNQLTGAGAEVIAKEAETTKQNIVANTLAGFSTSPSPAIATIGRSEGTYNPTLEREKKIQEEVQQSFTQRSIYPGRVATLPELPREESRPLYFAPLVFGMQTSTPGLFELKTSMGTEVVNTGFDSTIPEQKVLERYKATKTREQLTVLDSALSAAESASSIPIYSDTLGQIGMAAYKTGLALSDIGGRVKGSGIIFDFSGGVIEGAGISTQAVGYSVAHPEKLAAVVSRPEALGIAAGMILGQTGEAMLSNPVETTGMLLGGKLVFDAAIETKGVLENVGFKGATASHATITEVRDLPGEKLGFSGRGSSKQDIQEGFIFGRRVKTESIFEVEGFATEKVTLAKVTPRSDVLVEKTIFGRTYGKELVPDIEFEPKVGAAVGYKSGGKTVAIVDSEGVIILGAAPASISEADVFLEVTRETRGVSFKREIGNFETSEPGQVFKFKREEFVGATATNRGPMDSVAIIDTLFEKLEQNVRDSGTVAGEGTLAKVNAPTIIEAGGAIDAAVQKIGNFERVFKAPPELSLPKLEGTEQRGGTSMSILDMPFEAVQNQAGSILDKPTSSDRESFGLDVVATSILDGGRSDSRSDIGILGKVSTREGTIPDIGLLSDFDQGSDQKRGFLPGLFDLLTPKTSQRDSLDLVPLELPRGGIDSLLDRPVRQPTPETPKLEIPDVPTGLLGYPGNSGGSRAPKRRKGKRSGRRLFKYTPTLVGLESGRSVKRGNGIFTGLEVRLPEVR